MTPNIKICAVPYCPESSIEPYLKVLEAEFRKQPVGCAKQARMRIIHLTGIELSLSQIRRVMLRLGMRYRKAGQSPGKADTNKRLEFLDQELRPKLKDAAEGKRKVFFVDASRFVMGAVLGMLWSFARVFVRGASGRKRYNVLGTLDSETREVITVSNDTYITAPTVCELLEKLREHESQMPLTLVLDNAGIKSAFVFVDLIRWRLKRRVHVVEAETGVKRALSGIADEVLDQAHAFFGDSVGQVFFRAIVFARR